MHGGMGGYWIGIENMPSHPNSLSITFHASTMHAWASDSKVQKGAVQSLQAPLVGVVETKRLMLDR